MRDATPKGANIIAQREIAGLMEHPSQGMLPKGELHPEGVGPMRHGFWKHLLSWGYTPGYDVAALQAAGPKHTVTGAPLRGLTLRPLRVLRCSLRFDVPMACGEFRRFFDALGQYFHGLDVMALAFPLMARVNGRR